MGRNTLQIDKNFDDVIKMLKLKRKRFLKVFAECFKNSSIDFHQTYVIFRQSSIVSFEIKRSFIVAMVTNSRGSAGLKIMIEEKKSGIFLKISN